MSQKASFPKVGYTLTADYYFIIAYVFVVSVIIGIIYIQTINSQGKKENAKRLNQLLALGALRMVTTLTPFVLGLSKDATCTLRQAQGERNFPSRKKM